MTQMTQMLPRSTSNEICVICVICGSFRKAPHHAPQPRFANCVSAMRYSRASVSYRIRYALG